MTERQRMAVVADLTRCYPDLYIILNDSRSQHCELIARRDRNSEVLVHCAGRYPRQVERDFRKEIGRLILAGILPRGT